MDYFDSILKKTHRKAVMKRVIAVLSAVVLLFTINTTKKTADTLERIPTCGVEEHVHTDACFDVDGNLICGFVEHVHTDACYQERPKSVDTFEPPVEEYQIELSDVDQADNVLSASTEAGSEAIVMSMDIDAPVEELGELELEDINGEDNIAMPSDESEVFPESEESQGYIVGAQNPCYLSDIIADQGLNIAIDDVVEIGQAIENDDDPILFNFELVDGDIALYVKEDFERAELVITTEDALHVVELMFGIAPIEETGADAREAEVSEDEPADVALGDIDQEQAIEGEEREEALAEAAGDAVQAADVEDDQLISEPTEDEAELLDEAAEDIQVEQDAGKDDETVEQADESTEEIADAEESVDEQGDAVAADETEGEAESEKSDESKAEETEEAEDEESDEFKEEETEAAENEQAEEADGVETEEEAENEQADETEEEQTKEEAEDEKSDESKAEETEEAGSEKSDESKDEETEEETEDEKSDESKDEETEEETEDEKSDAADGEEIKEGAEDEQTGEVQGDETWEAPDDGARPVPPEVVYAYYEATIDLADVEVYPIALTDLMARATWLGVEETVPAADVEEAAAAEPVPEPVETEPAEADALEEDVPDEGTAEVVEAEAVDPVQSEATFELDGEDTVEPEVPEIPESDAWVMDYDASVLSVERDGDDYALSILTSFEQTTLTVDNGKQYRITLLNGAAPVLYPAAAFAASTEYVTVSVEAAEGAFPAGTTMVVRDVDDEDTLHGISDKVEEGFVRVERVHAVDITFLNADGEEIEPLIPISVVMTIREIEEEKEKLVVHVDHEGEAQLVDNTEPTTTEVSEQNSVVEAADESSAEAGTAVAFTAESFSVYAVVVGEKLETKVIAADGNTYRIEVTYTEDAGIPSGAALDVSEVTGDESYRALVEESLAENKRVTLARFFDIRIMNGAEVIQPAVPVTVKIELVSDENKDNEAVPCAVHFAEDEVQVIDATEEDEAVSFRAESFSVWGVVYTVDFHYVIDGEEFAYILPGGGFVRLSDLVRILGLAAGDGYVDLTGAEDEADGVNASDESEILVSDIEEAVKEAGETDFGNDDEAEDADEADAAAFDGQVRRFLEAVDAVTFSNPELVWTGRVEADTTIGALKAQNELKPQYSVNMSLAEVRKSDSQVILTGDWALISLLPFDTEETLTIRMENGEEINILVTDAQISRTFITAEGVAYRVTAIYDESAGIPDGAELEVSEITEGEAYDQLNQNAQLLLESADFSFVRIFDIDIICEGEKVKPDADVRIIIEYVDGNHPEEGEGVSVVHFADDGPVILSASTDTNDEGIVEVSFSTESFSPFATISERINNSTVSDSVIAFFNFDEIDGRGGFTSEINGITSYATPIVSNAVPDISPAFDGNVLKLDNSNDDALKVTKSDGSSLLTGLTQATISYWAYTTDTRTSWAYYAARNNNAQEWPNEHYLGAFNMSGNVYAQRFYNGRGNGNYEISADASNGAWHYVTVVYGTNITSLYVDGELKQTKSGQPALNNILGNNSIFQIGRANWNSGEFFTGYLDEMMILNRALNAEEAASLYNSGYAQNVLPEKQDKIDIRDLVSYALENGVDTVTGEGTTVPAGTYHTALPGKVLSDVIFYATEYNNGEYNYDYYAVTHDGGLVKVTDLGSEIIWKDPRNIKWDLIVYTKTVPVEDGPDLVVPSGYYELAYTDADGTTHYLAPQLNTDALVQGEPLGLQFAGPVAGDYGTTIEAWDSDDIEYAGLRIQHEGLTAVIGGTSEEFFFARNTKSVSYNEPRQVATIDSAAKGIQISLFDYNEGNNGKRPDWMKTLIGDGDYRYGHQVTLDLVKHNLNNGVPVASLTNNALTELFGENTRHVDAIYNNVNHLFLQGTYDETGYFSYNSAQNYAYYNNNGNFIVYDQAAAPGGTGSANYHGNFFPYNTFGQASDSQYMWYDVNDTLLTPDDPEYGIALRSLDNINYTFGMEMQTDFYMTKTGLDERGRDIVYEFNGDDDLWVFIDDKLALDIGGVHGAIHGTINFTTGEIIVASENMYSVTGETSEKDVKVAGSVRTTLAEQFRLAYEEQGKTETEITAILDSTFNKDGSGNYTSFKPYTTHNMKMFYMESGEGASNLNIRFNLPVIPPDSFVLEKELSEGVQAKYTDRRFAFKVFVQNGYNASEYVQITQDQVGDGKLMKSAVYENTTTPAVFEDGILYLRPGEAIQLTIRDERLKYYVQEVQIDPDLWAEVDINDAPVRMIKDSEDAALVSSDALQINQRARVVCENVPKQVRKLLINKIVESDDLDSIDPNLVYEFYVYLEGHSENLEPYSVGEYYLTKTENGVKHYFNNAYVDLGTEPQVCSRSGQYGTIGNIRAGYTIEISGLLPGTDFYVVEREDRIPDGLMFIRKTLKDNTYDEADEGISLVQDGSVFTPDGKLKSDVDAEVTIVNGDMTVNILKVDAIDMATPLKKAQFTLKKLDPEGYGTYLSGAEMVAKISTDTGTDGKTSIAGIRNGIYEISETAVPDGYILLDEAEFYIKVQNRNVTLLTKDTSRKAGEWTERALTDEDKLKFDGETITFTVGNTPGAVLPATGGPGTRLYTLSGIGLMALAAFMLLRKRARNTL